MAFRMLSATLLDQVADRFANASRERFIELVAEYHGIDPEGLRLEAERLRVEIEASLDIAPGERNRDQTIRLVAEIKDVDADELAAAMDKDAEPLRAFLAARGFEEEGSPR